MRRQVRSHVRCHAALALLLAALPWARAGEPAPPRIDPVTVLQLALAHNADLQFARLQAGIAAEGYNAETGLYQPVGYASLRREGRSRPRTVEERLTAHLLRIEAKLDARGPA